MISIPRSRLLQLARNAKDNIGIYISKEVQDHVWSAGQSFYRHLCMTARREKRHKIDWRTFQGNGKKTDAKGLTASTPQTPVPSPQSSDVLLALQDPWYYKYATLAATSFCICACGLTIHAASFGEITPTRKVADYLEDIKISEAQSAAAHSAGNAPQNASFMDGILADSNMLEGSLKAPPLKPNLIVAVYGIATASLFGILFIVNRLRFKRIIRLQCSETSELTSINLGVHPFLGFSGLSWRSVPASILRVNHHQLHRLEFNHRDVLGSDQFLLIHQNHPESGKETEVFRIDVRLCSVLNCKRLRAIIPHTDIDPKIQEEGIQGQDAQN